MQYRRFKKSTSSLILFVIIAVIADKAHAAPDSCSFAGGSTGAISFSTINPSSAGPINGAVTQQVLFTCNNIGINYTITATPASGWTLASGINAMPFTPGLTASGTWNGTPVNVFTASSSIAQTDYQNAPAGAYANSSAITIQIRWKPGAANVITATIPIGNVSGTVTNACVVSQSAGALTFTIDPSVVGSTTAAIPQDLLIKCTMAAPVNITATSACGGAAPVLDSSYPACGGSTIPYTFTFLPGAVGQGFGAGKDIALGIGGTVTSANYANAPVGSYGDLQTITVSY